MYNPFISRYGDKSLFPMASTPLLPLPPLEDFSSQYRSKKSYKTDSASPTTKMSIKSDNGKGLELAQGPPAMISGSSLVRSSLLNGILASLSI